MLGCKGINNPIERNNKLKEDNEISFVDKGRYQ
jgi:hypothetical protein